MKKIFFSLLISIYWIVSYSQCAYRKNEKDEFTNTEYKITENIKIAITYTSAVAMDVGEMITKEKDTSYFLTMTYNFGEVKCVKEGSDLYLKLSNDSILTITAISTKIDKIMTVKYFINYKDLFLLKFYALKKLRVYTTDDYYEWDINEENKSKIQTMVKCII